VKTTGGAAVLVTLKNFKGTFARGEKCEKTKGNVREGPGLKQCSRTAKDIPKRRETPAVGEGG